MLSSIKYLIPNLEKGDNMSKMLKFNEKALKSIFNGIKTLAKVVKVTLGPKGRNVIIKKDFDLQSTKDGVTVAGEITLKDPFENMGAQIVKEAASKTNVIAGDGTTTAIVLAESIYSEGIKNVIAGNNPMEIKKGIEIGVKTVIQKLTELSQEIKTEDEIKQIACISANNDEEIGKIISEAMKKVGKDGIITLGEAKGIDTTLDVVEGMQFDSGFISPYFITNPEKLTVEFEKPNILITEEKLTSAQDIVLLLEKAMEKDSKPLIIIAEDVDSDALSALVVNKVKAQLPICAVKAPAFGDRKKQILEDIAIITGAEVVSKEKAMQLNEITSDVFGSCKKIKISKDNTTIIDGFGNAEKINQRIMQIKTAIQDSKSDYDIEKLQERLAKLLGGVAVINVGATTETEMKEKKQRVEDALHATRAAVIEGIVPGGGIALIRCIDELEKLELSKEQKIGADIIKKACFMPAKTIADNAGAKGDLIAEKIYEKKGAWGYNSLTEKFSDLIKDGVIDPVLVTKHAIINAASISSLLITVDAMITDRPDKKKEEPSMPMGGGIPQMGIPNMGGMPMM